MDSEQSNEPRMSGRGDGGGKRGLEAADQAASAIGC